MCYTCACVGSASASVHALCVYVSFYVSMCEAASLCTCVSLCVRVSVCVCLCVCICFFVHLCA